MRQDSGSQSVFRGTITRVPLHHTTSCRNPKLVSQARDKICTLEKKLWITCVGEKSYECFPLVNGFLGKKRIADKP